LRTNTLALVGGNHQLETIQRIVTGRGRSDLCDISGVAEVFHVECDAALYPAVKRPLGQEAEGSKEKTGCCFILQENHVFFDSLAKRPRENNIADAIRRICFMIDFSDEMNFSILDPFLNLVPASFDRFMMLSVDHKI